MNILPSAETDTGKAKWRFRAFLIAIAGGLFGILGAIIQEISQNIFLVVFVAGPMIEEVMKPAGVYLLLVRWPETLTSRLYTALLAALGGLSFAVVENILYLQVYFPEHTQALVVFRYSVNLTIHTLTSFIFGFGINQKLLASVRGEIPFLKGNKKFFIIAMVIHSLFNIAAVIFGSRLGV
ncbi:MAG: PrsW family glutamic-type intramembrane protease [Dehalococcoidales bacterium]|nr:PrsW family glutamic-type intramembrane protease [Dehalococcoidales bacterium]